MKIMTRYDSLSRDGYSHIPVALLAVFCEVEIPLGDPLHGSVASCCEGPKEVEGRRRLAIGSDHPLGIRDPGFLVERIAIDIVSSVARKLYTVLLLEGI